MSDPRLRDLRAPLTFCLALLILGLAASYTTRPPQIGTSIWPPLGLAFGYFYARGFRMLPAFLLINSLLLLRESMRYETAYSPVESTVYVTLLSALYALQMYCSVRIVRWWFGAEELLVRPQRIAAFFLLSGPVHVLPVSLIGTGSTCLLGQYEWNAFLLIWANWYGSDLFGVMLFSMPSLIIWGRPRSVWHPRMSSVVMPTALALTLTAACYFAARIREDRLAEDQFQNEIRTVQFEAGMEMKYAELFARRYTYVEASTIRQAREKNTKAAIRLAEMIRDVPWVLGAACATVVPYAERIEYEDRADPSNPATARFPIESSGSAGAGAATTSHVVVTAWDGRSALRPGLDLRDDPSWAELFREATKTCDLAFRLRTYEKGSPTVQCVFPCLPDPSWNAPKIPHGFFVVEFDIDAMLANTVRNRNLSGSLRLANPEDPAPTGRSEYPFALKIGQSSLAIVGRHSSDPKLHHLPGYSMLIGCGGAMLTILFMTLLLTSTGQNILTNEEVVRRTTALEREMTTRKTVEASLRMSESSLMESQRLAGLGYWEWKRSVDGLYWSPILSELLGFQGSDVRMQLEDLTARVHPDERDRITSLIEHMNVGSPPVDTEFRIQRADGSFRWFEAVISPSRGGSDSGVRGTMLDVTDRKRTEMALRDGEARLRIALHSAMMGTWEWVLDGDEMIWDARQQAIFGFAEGTFDRRVRTFLNRIYPTDRTRIERTMRTIRETGEPFTDEFRIVRPDGEIRWVAGYGHPLGERPGSRPRYVGIYLDITDRKRNELALRESEDRRRLALDAGGMGTMIWDLPSERMSWDHKLHALFDMEAGAFDGTPTTFLSRIDLVDRKTVDRQLEQFIYEGATANRTLEFRISLAEGVRWLTGHFHLLNDAAGRPLRVVGILFDSTERRKIEDALRAGREMLKRAQALARIGSFDWNPKSDTTTWSDEMYRLLGYEPNTVEPSYENFIRRAHPDDRGMIKSRFDAAIEQDEPYDFEFRILKPDGEVRYVAVQAELLRNERGEILSFRGVNQDITERKLFEKQLQHSEARLNEAQRVARAGSWEWNKNTDAVWPSLGLLEICGFEPGQGTRGDDYIDRTHVDDVPMLRAAIELAIAERTELKKEYRFLRGDGKERWFSVRARFEFPDNGEIVMIGTTQDVTELKRDEEERRKFSESMQQTQKLESLGILAGGVAHDFNNLLTGILGNAGLARELLPSNSEMHEFLRPIEKSAEHAAELCQQMLVYAGKGTTSRGQVDLNELIDDSLDLLKLAASRKAKLVFDLTPKLPVVEGDAGRLRQILLNLVQNASEALPQSGGEIHVRTGRQDQPYVPESGMVLSGLPPESEALWLEIADNGSGMPPETLARIFEPFFTTKFTGRGLGLSAVHGIVRDHGGCLAVGSEIGRGTTFRIVLPSDIGMRATPVPTDVTPPPVGWSETKRRTALVVDDEPTLLGIAGFSLRSLGFSLEECRNGREAITKFRARPDDFSLILLDLELPDQTGCDVLREIRKLRPDVHVILVGGGSDRCSPDSEPDLRVSYLEKPYRAVDLTSAVRRVMNTSYSVV